MLQPGEPAPNFSLPDDVGRETTLADLIVSGPLSLFLYPADFTPVCTQEVCMFRDLLHEMAEQFAAAGLSVAGISPDTIEKHAEFKERYALPFPLLADPDKNVIRSYDADGPLGIGVRRVTYVIDEGGTIVDAMLADLRVSRHEEFVRRALAR
jgi:peroxiredoxin Q/BCP